MTSTKAGGKTFTGFTEDERAAMKARAKELVAEARASKDKAQGEHDVQEAISVMSEPDRSLGKRLHVLIKAAAPVLIPKTWYGMPAYATKEGKIVCYFRPAAKFKERYMMFGFNDSAKLDDGHLWPVAFALTQLTPLEEARISSLVVQAVS